MLFEEFLGHLQLSLIRIQQQSIERINEQTGAERNARLTFWRYLDPNLRAMKDLSDAQLGITDQDNIQDMQRRKRKAELLREFNAEVKRFTKKAAYVVCSGSDSNQRLEQALELVRQALKRAKEDLGWSENQCKQLSLSASIAMESKQIISSNQIESTQLNSTNSINSINSINLQ